MSDITDLPVEAGEEIVEVNGGEPAEPSEASKAIAIMGLTRMSLQELKEKTPADLLAFAEQFDIENANAMRKQDMMFAILKTAAEEGVEIFGFRHPRGCAGRFRLPAQPGGQLPAGA